MGRTQKYSEDQLLEAVVKFSEIEKKKIKATELAKWCRDNFEGLEEVRDYHFTRAIIEKDEKSGKMIKKPKICTLKIEEINKARCLIVNVNTNLLLRASNIDTFMDQPDIAKRKMIVETRETVDKLISRNRSITRENEALKAENKSLKSDILEMTKKVESLQKAQKKLTQQVNNWMKVTDEISQKKLLAQMGLEDGSVDLNTYIDSIHLELAQIMDINKDLNKYFLEAEDELATKDDHLNFVDGIMSGLDF